MSENRLNFGSLPAICLCIALAFACLVDARADDASSPAAENFEAFLKDSAGSDEKALVENFATWAKPLFTFTIDSKSRQKGARGLLCTGDGQKIFGVKPGSDLETIVQEPSGQTHFFASAASNHKFHLLDSNPDSCRECHSRKLVYISEDYGRNRTAWPSMLGGKDDQVSKESTHLSHVRDNSIWSALFALKKPHSPAAFPYWSEGGDRILSNMPNTMFAETVGRRAAKKLSYEITHDSPANYERFKNLLTRQLLYCPLLGGEQEKIDEAYANVPAQFRGWHLNPNLYQSQEDTQILKVLQILGTNPNEIILKHPDRGATPGQKIQNALKDYDEGSPLQWEFGTDEFMSDHLLGFLFHDVSEKDEILKEARYGKSPDEVAPPALRGTVDLAALNKISQAYDRNKLSKAERARLCTRLRRQSAKALNIPDDETLPGAASNPAATTNNHVGT